ncbi:MAG TPA: hypothetical protein P5142_00285 [Spirochaetia bacterium]|nr:hypothetical protein [Spirochaetia bacterium]
MQSLPIDQIEFLVERVVHQVSFYYGGGQDGGDWHGDIRAVLHYHLTGQDEPTWHREIYGDLGPLIKQLTDPASVDPEALTLESIP